MSPKPRHAASHSSPPSGSKLTKFLHKAGAGAARDRSKSVTDPPGARAPSPSFDAASQLSKGDASGSGRSRGSLIVPKSVSKFVDRSRASLDVDRSAPTSPPADEDDELFSTPADSPVVVEPPSARPRPPRPGQADAALLYAAPAARITDLPSRLSGWFSHTFAGGSSPDLSLPGLLATVPSSPVKGSGKPPNPLLTAAKHGKGHLDKAMRYLLDSDATPDRCPDPIWILGVQHVGYDPTASPGPPDARTSADARRSPVLRAVASASTDSLAAQQLAHVQAPKNPAALWPAAFYADFSTRVWLTYRSHYQPIRDTSLSQLEKEIGQAVANTMSTSPNPRRWWGGEKGWTSDTGWGCMLRTGQSLLANSLLHLHLGRGAFSTTSDE